MDDMFDLDNAIQTMAEFSCAIAVMDKIGWWGGETLGWIQIHGMRQDRR